MTICLPVYRQISIEGYQMFPGKEHNSGLFHSFSPGLHLVAGVNGLGKSTLLLALYHGVVGAASIRSDEYGVPRPEVIPHRLTDRFRKRVADGARSALLKLQFSLGSKEFSVCRSLHDLSIIEWSINDSIQPVDQSSYETAITSAMRVSSFADVLILLNLVVFMFEERSLLIWTPLAQRNVLRALFMSPDKAKILANRAQKVATSNSAYRNLLYLANRDKKKLARARTASEAADSLSAEYHTLQEAIAAQSERLTELYALRNQGDDARTECRTTLEVAKFNFDDYLRELEALKLTRVANTFPTAPDAGRYIIDRLLGDKSCLVCGADDGPLIARWVATVRDGDCVVCGAPPKDQEAIVPTTTVDAARISRVEGRLDSARQALEAAQLELEAKQSAYDKIQGQIDQLQIERRANETRVRQIAGSLPPTPPELRALEERVANQNQTLAELKAEQADAETAFSSVFLEYQETINDLADQIRERFAARISEFLLERAEISFTTTRGPIGESGKSYEWPAFRLSMTSGTFDNPSPRLDRSEVSMSQGEFIDLAFRLALVEVAAGDGPASLIFDAPEASLDALFMRRAGAFLARFAEHHAENRLIVTSNLTNADMIPALFGAYNAEAGDPNPLTIPREKRWDRVVDLLKIAAPTSAVQMIGDRYDDLLNKALFPPQGKDEPGL